MLKKPFVLDVIIETSKGSNIKYEYDRKNKITRVDRILYGSNHYPHNYGFIKEALDWDGDELDCLVISDQAFAPNIIVPTRIIGAMGMIDDGETDTKLIGVIACDPRYNHVCDLKDLNQHHYKEIEHFFLTYKMLQNKQVKVTGFKDVQWAYQEYLECVKLMKKYGKLNKNEFVKQMQKLHPERYDLKK